MKHKTFSFKTGVTRGIFCILPSDEGLFIAILCIPSASFLCYHLLRYKFSHPQEIIGSPYKPNMELRPASASESGFSESPYCLHPPKYLLNPLSNMLAYGVYNMTGGPFIYGRTAFSFNVLRYMRCYHEGATLSSFKIVYHLRLNTARSFWNLSDP